MFRVEVYGRVRRAVRVEGRSQRAVAREFDVRADPGQQGALQAEAMSGAISASARAVVSPGIGTLNSVSRRPATPTCEVC
jgi:hypothetical protein